MTTLREKMTDETMDPMTQKLAAEAYTRYADDYERDHPGARQPPWGELDLSVQLRWQVALAPVAQRVREGEAMQGDLDRLRDRAERLREARDGLDERFSTLQSALTEAQVELSDVVAFGQLPSGLADAVAKLQAAVTGAHMSA